MEKQNFLKFGFVANTFLCPPQHFLTTVNFTLCILLHDFFSGKVAAQCWGLCTCLFKIPRVHWFSSDKRSVLYFWGPCYGFGFYHDHMLLQFGNSFQPEVTESTIQAFEHWMASFLLKLFLADFWHMLLLSGLLITQPRWINRSITLLFQSCTEIYFPSVHLVWENAFRDYATWNSMQRGWQIYIKRLNR